MPYIGQPPVVGDTTSSFRLLDNIASYTLTFDATSSDIVSTTNNTLTFSNHRFVTAQRVTYSAGGGTEIGGLTDGTAYFIIKVDQNIIKLATSAANANAGTAIALSSGAVGNSHTLNIAFDGINTKFKATYNNGTKAKISRAGQLLLSINGVIQQPQETSAPTVGFGIDADSTIVFSTAPADTDVVFGNIIANTIASFDLSENTVDNFTGDGSTVSFSLSKTPPNNQNVLVTLDGVVQYPSDTTTTRAYSVVGNLLTFSGAPGNGVEIQVRHIGFAGATTSAVTGFYGRTGNAVLTSADDITVQNITGVAATFTGNVSIAGTLTYEDVTNIDSVGLITARSGAIINTGTATTALIVNGDARITGILTVGSSSVTIDGDNNEIKVGTGVTITTSGIVATAGVTTVSAGSTSAPSITPVGDPDTGIFFPSADTIAFGEGGSEAARFDSSGRLLVGTTSNLSASDNRYLQISESNPFVIFHHNGNNPTANTTLAGLEYGGQAGGSYVPGAFIRAQTDGDWGSGDAPTRLTFSTTADGASSPTERLRIDSQGRMGLGTASPAELLHVSGNIRAGTGDGSWIGFGDSTSHLMKFKSSLNGIALNGYGAIAFETNGANERARIDSSGRLLIGTTTSNEHIREDQKLAIVSTGAVFGGASITTYAGATLNDLGSFIDLNRSRGSTDGSMTSVADNDALGWIVFQGSDGTDFKRAAWIKGEVDGSPASNDMPGALTFATTPPGTSLPRERLRITSDGTIQLSNSPGIDFSQIQTNAAGATSEILDSYEEGTWTPYYSSAGATTPYLTDIVSSYNLQNGRYTKVGRKVFIEMYLQCAASISYQNGGADGQIVVIAGLPFINNNAATYPAISVGYYALWNSWSAGYTPMGYVNNNSGYIQLTFANGAGTTNVLTTYAIRGNAGILLAGSYTVP